MKMNPIYLVLLLLYRLVIAEEKAIQTVQADDGSSCNQVIRMADGLNGTIETMGYPGPYSRRKVCTFLFHGDSKRRLLLQFRDFYLFHPQGEKFGHNTSCDGLDSLQIYDGTSHDASLLNIHCGSAIPLPVMSSQLSLKLVLTSYTSGPNARGFKADYAFVNNFGIVHGLQETEGNCTFEYDSKEAKIGQISSPNPGGMYPRNTVCVYTFNGKFMEQVLLTFHYFDVEGIDPCTEQSGSDYLEFSSLPGFDPCPARRCGPFGPQEVVSEGPYFSITFSSNDNLDGRGFLATYRFIQKKDLPHWVDDEKNGVELHLLKPSAYLFMLIYLFYQ